MKNITLKAILTIMAFLGYGIAIAQISFTKKQIDGTMFFATGINNSSQKAVTTDGAIILRALTNCKSEFDFRINRSYSDQDNFKHTKYKVFYKDLEVIGMDFVTHSKNNFIEVVNGSFENFNYANTKPTLDERSAITLAMSFFKANSKSNLVKNTKTSNAGLYLIRNILVPESKYELAYKILIDENGFESKYVYVNGFDGTIINFENLVCSTNSPGTAQTRYSGTQNFVTDQVGSQYRLREVRNGVNIKTLNANFGGDQEVIVNSATDFWDSNDNNWTSAEHGSNNVATDVHWAMEKNYDYWLNVHNRNSINNAGMDISAYVHVGINYDNAYWSRTKFAMFYGDGDLIARPLTSLDICAHELGHGICQFTSDLSIVSGSESFALNEGFSDIWGASVEYYAAPNKQRWLIGEEITKRPPYHLRSMSNPPDGYGVQSPDTYQDVRWNSQSDGHYRSGVLNKWYYLLSDGGSGTNGIGNVYSVTGITIAKAEKIAYKTELLLNSNANYAMARTMSIQAAQEIYGVGSCEEVAVIRAWYAVGVGTNYPVVPTLTINGGIALCNSSSQYSVNTTSNVTWSLSPAGIATLSPSGNSVIVTPIGSGAITLTADVSNVCSAQQPIPKQIFSNPAQPYISTSYTHNGTQQGTINFLGEHPYANSACIGAVNATVYVPLGSSVSWSKVSPTSSSSGPWTQVGNNLNFTMWSYVDYIFEATVTNGCDQPIVKQYLIRPTTCGGTGIDPGGCLRYVVSPNPSNGFIKIQVDSKPAPQPCKIANFSTDANIVKLELLDIIGNKVKDFLSLKSKTVTISTIGVKKGNYYLRIMNSDGYVETHQILIQ